MSETIILILVTVAGTLLGVVGLYRAYTAARQAEPKALGEVVLAALHAAEMDIVAKRAAADAARTEADNAASQLDKVRATVAGNASPLA